MSAKNFALAVGVLYMIVGILGFFPGLLAPVPAGAPELAVNTGYGYLFGLFPVNVLHNFVHLGIGVWGVVAYRSLANSITFARGLAIIYGALTIMGFIPVLKTTFGLIPVFGHDIWLHAVTAIVAAYFGYGGAAAAMPAERAARRAS